MAWPGAGRWTGLILPPNAAGTRREAPIVPPQQPRIAAASVSAYGGKLLDRNKNCVVDDLAPLKQLSYSTAAPETTGADLRREVSHVEQAHTRRSPPLSNGRVSG